ncbi:MAG: hypothetical protein WC891_03180 [Actinomycetota bacterium]
MAEKEPDKTTDSRGAGALFIPAGLFLGFGVGFLLLAAVMVFIK